MNWIDLVTLVVVSHQVIIHRKKCLRARRWSDWYSPIWGIYGTSVTFTYQSRVGYTPQQWGRYRSMARNIGLLEQIWKEFRYLNAVVFVLLVEYGGIILWVTPILGVRRLVLGFNLYKRQWVRIGWGGWEMLWVCAQNDCHGVGCSVRHVVVGGVPLMTWEKFEKPKQWTGSCRWVHQVPLSLKRWLETIDDVAQCCG